jgi:urocanate hydratase
MQAVRIDATGLQVQMLRLYGELVARRESWAGKLVFACGAGASATGLAAAVSIAGGTSLVVDSDALAVKAVFRAGGVDFVVNTLDEALRILKNEIRKHRPVSVALVGSVGPALAEMLERGVLPDLQVSMGSQVEGMERMGAEELVLTSEGGVAVPGAAPSSVLGEWLGARGWFEVVLERAMMAEMRELDARLLALLPEDLRRTWVQRVGHYQRVAANGARVVWLTAEERRTIDSLG